MLRVLSGIASSGRDTQSLQTGGFEDDSSEAEECGAHPARVLPVLKSALKSDLCLWGELLSFSSQIFLCSLGK